MAKSNSTSRKNPRANRIAARAHTAYITQDPAETLENCRHVLAFCQTVDMAALPQQPMMGFSQILNFVERALEHVQHEIQVARP
jgi:GTP cyclohydrolase I